MMVDSPTKQLLEVSLNLVASLNKALLVYFFEASNYVNMGPPSSSAHVHVNLVSNSSVYSLRNLQHPIWEIPVELSP